MFIDYGLTGYFSHLYSLLNHKSSLATLDKLETNQISTLDVDPLFKFRFFTIFQKDQQRSRHLFRRLFYIFSSVQNKKCEA